MGRVRDWKVAGLILDPVVSEPQIAPDTTTSVLMLLISTLLGSATSV